MRQTIHKVIRITLSITGLLSLPVLAQAVPVTWEFTGNVVATNVGGGTYWDDLGVELGDTVTGRVTFDPDAALATASAGTDGYGGTTLNSSFDPSHALIHDVFVNGGQYAPGYASPTSRLRSNLNTTHPGFAPPNTDPYDTFAIDNFESGFQRFQVVRIFAQPVGNGIIPSNTFPNSLPDFADLLHGHNYIQELDSNGGTSGLLAEWTNVQVVPAPASLIVLLLGLVRPGLRRR